MIRRVVLLLLAVLAAAFGLAATAAAGPEGATRPMTLRFEQAGFVAQVTRVCDPRCTDTVRGVFVTAGAPEECYRLESSMRGLWLPFTEPQCGLDKSRVTQSWHTFPPGFYRICRGVWPDCGPEVRTPVWDIHGSPATAAAPLGSISVSHPDGRAQLSASAQTVCNPACVTTVSGVFDTRAPRLSCYWAEAFAGTNWTDISQTQCGASREQVREAFRFSTPTAYRVCRQGALGQPADCGPPSSG
ncbi:hypothetical protein [Crossiella cryophila]|uniref:Uncharacterized protein n=1 Tax=Crossiella cryophila TaxID=43355 RepID=A0A7W7FSZ4_9PSEU|nr:hypothetical protein [Crossiella cryophila]MBB4677586.1 hypothetical protein [Crossiella cryophila]